MEGWQGEVTALRSIWQELRQTQCKQVKDLKRRQLQRVTTGFSEAKENSHLQTSFNAQKSHSIMCVLRPTGKISVSMKMSTKRGHGNLGKTSL